MLSQSRGLPAAKSPRGAYIALHIGEGSGDRAAVDWGVRRNDRVGDYVVVDGLHNGRSLCGRLITWLKSVMEEIMDWNRVQGSWKQLEGKIKAKWGKLTADDLTTINGRREELEGKIQQRYGVAKDEARKEIDDWFTSQGF